MSQNFDQSRAREFEVLVERALTVILDAESLVRDSLLADGIRADFIARLRDGRDAIIEVKEVTPTTKFRIDTAAGQLRELEKAYLKDRSARSPMLVLVISGTLSPEHVDQLSKLGIERVIDGPILRAMAPGLPWSDAVAQERSPAGISFEDSITTDHPLARDLASIPSGISGWSLYQRTVRDILAFTLSPPLSKPLDENATRNGVNRRDIIFPNYAGEGLWKFIRDHYQAHFVVVDAKNSGTGVKKEDVLQVANYLSAHGAGLFGIIVCRSTVHQGAEVTRREQWIIHRKLIIFLYDDDLKQMLSLSMASTDPGIVIRQKIEDFRLGL